MNMRFRNHAALPHFSRGPQAPTFLKPGLKSTQKSPLTLPTNPGLRINWDKFGSAQEDGNLHTLRTFSIHIGSEKAGPRVAAIVSIVETCRRLGIPVRDFLGPVLPGSANFPINRIAELTPVAWAARI